MRAFSVGARPSKRTPMPARRGPGPGGRHQRTSARVSIASAQPGTTKRMRNCVPTSKGCSVRMNIPPRLMLEA